MQTVTDLPDNGALFFHKPCPCPDMLNCANQ